MELMDIIFTIFFINGLYKDNYTANNDR